MVRVGQTETGREEDIPKNMVSMLKRKRLAAVSLLISDPAAMARMAEWLAF